MSETWRGVPEPAPHRLTAGDWFRVALRALPLGVLVFGCLGLLLLVRLIERPLCGTQRPVGRWGYTPRLPRKAFR